MSAIVWFLRIIILLLVLRFVLRMLFPPPVRRRRRTPVERTPERVGGELVRDPNCGTHVLKARAIAVGTGADIKYFCSTTCRDEYAARN